nr:unnamed protein product [Digitaria exilis]
MRRHGRHPPNPSRSSPNLQLTTSAPPKSFTRRLCGQSWWRQGSIWQAEGETLLDLGHIDGLATAAHGADGVVRGRGKEGVISATGRSFGCPSSLFHGHHRQVARSARGRLILLARSPCSLGALRLIAASRCGMAMHVQHGEMLQVKIRIDAFPVLLATAFSPLGV